MHIKPHKRKDIGITERKINFSTVQRLVMPKIKQNQNINELNDKNNKF